MSNSNKTMRYSRTAHAEPQDAGSRVDQVAARYFDAFSRAQLSRWIERGELTVNGAVVRPKHRLKGGELLTLQAVVEPRENWLEAQPDTLNVLHEDEHLLLLNKAPGMVVHPGAGNPDHTLVNALLAYRPALAAVPRAGVVHRLDKNTSGIMVVAADLAAHTALIRMIAKRQVQRSYTAVVEGVMTAGATMDAPIGRDPHRRTRQAVREDGKPARTDVLVQRRFRAHTCIEAQLHTGRTHQIRVHMQHAGYPLVGDRLYGARRRLPTSPTTRLMETVQGFTRQALHAHQLAFPHPVTREPLEFAAPLPDDLADLIDALEEDDA